MKIIAIVQARLNSKRFPGKTLKVINGIPIIELLIKRLSFSKKINQVVTAIPNDRKNKKLYSFLHKKKYQVFRGDGKNVLKRFYKAAKLYKANIIVRITGDCPLVDSNIVDALVNKLIVNKKDYITNSNPPTYPDGLDVEVFTFKALKKCYKLAKSNHDKEHVTPYIRSSKRFKILYTKYKKNYSNHRWTVDEENDFKVVKQIFENFKPKINFGWLEVIKLSKRKPKIFEINKNIKRNEGLNISTGQKIWKRAKNIIPGGNMLLSKRPELILPNIWPTYYSRAKGCHVWDLDKKKYTDISLMGVGTNILGYANREIDKYVINSIKKSNVSSLNCFEEVLLCEKLIDLHPWADMAKLARTGGEANSMAIRIARAASGKDKVAFCGYHGWHDWYLSANLLNKKNLDNHLLSGLTPKGVPSALRNTAFPFEYNDYEGLKKITDQNKIGVIKMEVERNIKPNNNFLKKVRELATKKNIVLIFDECTSGFRESFGGLHKKYKVNPDIAIFGKALGNGYAITAIIGKRSVMDHAQDTFISSTFWSERSGPAAAIKTLEIMEKTESWKTITEIGKYIDNNWIKLGKKHGINFSTSGLTSIKSFNIDSNKWLKYKTFISQEMFKKGFLASNTVFACINHNKKILSDYLHELDTIFKIISDCEKGKSIDEKLETSVCKTGFQRLN